MSPPVFWSPLFRRGRRARWLTAAFSLAAAAGAFAIEAVEPVGRRQVQAPVAVRRVTPVHPPELKKSLVSGEVVLECVVDAEGKVQNIHVVSESHAGFGEAATEALQRWEFKPGMIDGAPAPVRIRVPFEFKLSPEEILETMAGRPIFMEVSETLIPATQLPSWPQPKQIFVPRYPSELEGSGKYGKAVVNITIDKDGKVINPRIVKATYPEFILPALATALKLEFPPQVMANREKIHVNMDIQFDFKSSTKPKAAPAKAKKSEKSK